MAHVTPDPVNPNQKPDVKEFKSPAEVTNAGALQLCVNDTLATESWLQSNYWSLRWREADNLYQSPPSITMWEGTTVPRSNVNRFVVAETVNSIHPQIMNGLFYETPPFILRPRPSITENVGRAIKSLISIELDEMGLRQETDWGLFSALNFGTGIWKWGFESFVKKETKYEPLEAGVKIAPLPVPGAQPTVIETENSQTYKKVEKDRQVHRPTFEAKDNRYVLVDPGLKVPDIRKAKFVIDKMYLTYKDLIKLKDEEYVDVVNGKQTLKKRYDLPDEKTIRSWFEKPQEQATVGGATEMLGAQGTQVHHAKPQFEASTADPLDEPLEVLERWDNDKVITVLQRVKVIRNEPNEFGCIPFLSVNWWNIPNAFWGLGLGRVIGVEQRVQAGLINACLDLASLIVNPMFVRSRGANVAEQQIRQRIGGIIAVDGDTTKALTLLQQPSIPAEVVQQIALSQSRVEMTSGANQQLTMGASTTRGGAMRTGTGAAGVIQATMNRIGGFAEAFVRQVYEPLIYTLHKLNKEKMPIAYIKQILGEHFGKEYEQFEAGNFLNSPAEFEVLAGSHLAAKSQMAQSLFMMLQLFENKPLMDQLNNVNHKKVDIEELFHMVHDISGWKNYYSIIKDMDPSEIQRMEQNSPMAQLQAKAQIQSQQDDKKFDQSQQLVDQENEARAVRDIFRVIAEKSAEPEALLGAAAPSMGLGSGQMVG